MTYEYECLICGKEFELQQSMNAKHEAYHCGVESRRIFTVFHTNKDLIYCFTAPEMFKKGYDFHSKRQFERVCKENGAVNISPSERKSIKLPKFEDFSHKREKCAERIATEIAKDGLQKPFKQLAKDYFIKKET